LVGYVYLVIHLPNEFLKENRNERTKITLY
jgi:hypothetical protein